MTKRILVTGGCGFIGSAVVRRLLEEDCELRVVDDLSKPESSLKALEDSGRVEFIRQDLTDAARTLELFRGFDLCVNLAAKIGGIGYFHRYPANILSENNRIYSSTFDAAVSAGLERMLYVSSSMVFESTDRFPSREADVAKIPPPRSAYGCSKLIGEWYCRAYLEQFGLPFTIIRPFNAYGVNEAPGDDIGYAHVIPDLVKKFFSGQHPLELLGSGNQTRCYTHVSDIADGLVTALFHPAAQNEDFNISNAEEVTVLELAQRLHALCAPDRPFEVTRVKGFEHDIARRVPSVEKAQTLLGWRAKYRLDDKLPEVVEWLRTWLRQNGGAQS